MDSTNPNHTKPPRVSISLITYNHAPYIKQSIESVLMQEADFDYELIIGEDDSKDGTREVVLAYQEKYPDKIKVLLNKREDVIYIDGKPTGRWNLINNLQHCQGEYIAMLEGDDYWTDPKKLQKQVDHLDNNLDHSMCFHKVIYISEENEFPPTVNEPYQTRSSYSLEDLIQKNFIPSLSVLYRNNDFFAALPQWFYTVPVGDYFLHLIIAEQGRIGYINVQMGVRRVHESGFWSSMNIVERNETALRISDRIFSHYKGSQYEDVARSSLFYTRYRSDYSKRHYYSSLRNLVLCLQLTPRHLSVYDRGLIKSILDIFIPAGILRWIGKTIRSINPSKPISTE